MRKGRTDDDAPKGRKGPTLRDVRGPNAGGLVRHWAGVGRRPGPRVPATWTRTK